MNRFLNLFFISALLPALAGCATVLDGTTQKIKFSTPGSDDVRCIADNGLRYSIWANETVSIERSRKPLVIDCYASGNRHIHKVVDSVINSNIAWNVTNAVVPGVGYDNATAAFWSYPDEIVFDFTTIRPPGYPRPVYHSMELKDLTVGNIENYDPSILKKQYELESPYRPMKRRAIIAGGNYIPSSGMPPGGPGAAMPPVPLSPGMPSTAQPGSQPPATMPATPPPAVPRGSTAEELNRAMNPSVFAQ
jgi:hypothetical protein